MIWRCDLSKQYNRYRAEIDEAIRSVMESGRYTLGTQVSSFERNFAEYIGMKYGIGVNSGTDALILALKAAGAGEGCEVITTPFTAIPTYSAIIEAGATPVFADIEEDTFLMDLKRVEELITDRTKAVVAVHLFGNIIDIPALRQITGEGICIIEDCAQSHGGEIRGIKAGSMGDLSAFSFYPTKNLGAYGDGGMVLVNDDTTEERLKRLRMYGMVNKDRFVTDGVNSRLDELQAAILNVKLKYLDDMNEARRVKAEKYSDMLGNILKPQKVATDVKSAWHLYSSLCREIDREELVEYLASIGIQTNVYYPLPLNEQEGYVKKYGKSKTLPVTRKVADSIIALPFYPEIEEELIDKVIKGVKDFVGAGV